MEKIYEAEVEDMSNLLKEAIDKFAGGYEVSAMEPLFCVSRKQFRLLKTVSNISNYQVRNGCWRLCAELCKQKNIEVIEMPEINNVDFIIKFQGKKVGVSVSFEEDFMPEVEASVMEDIDELVVVVLKEAKGENAKFNRPYTLRYRNYKYKDKIENITIKQFFEMLGRSDYEDFKGCVGRYNYDAEQALGITVSAIPTKEAIEKHKINVKKELLSTFYYGELQTIFSADEIADMRSCFEKNYEAVLSDADFAKSFISSEWYYDLQVKTDGGLEQTAIVAGYLKSLEQLLFSILLVLSEDEKNKFMFFVNSRGKAQTTEQMLPLNKKNQKLVLTMAGSLVKVIKKKKEKVMRKTSMTSKVISYLEMYVDETRNAYLHKENLYEQAKIESIRVKTYTALFLILGTFFIDVKKLSEIEI